MSSRLAVLLLSFVAVAAVACAGDDGGSSTAARHERVFVVDGRAVFELAGTDTSRRTTIAEPPKDGFIYDAAVSREGVQIAMSIQTAPIQSAGGYDFGIDLFVGRLGEEPLLLTAHEGIGASITR